MLVDLEKTYSFHILFDKCKLKCAKSSWLGWGGGGGGIGSYNPSIPVFL